MPPDSLTAQVVPERSAEERAFTHLTPAIGVGVARLGGPWDRFWTSGAVVDISVGAPLGGGRVRGGVHFGAGDPRSDAVPGFSYVGPYLEWGPAGSWGAVDWGVGAGAGFYRMSIDRADNPDETEAAIGVGADVATALRGDWRLGLRAQYRQVLTAEPLRQPVVSLEVGRRIGTGERLRRVLEGPPPGAVEDRRFRPDPWTGRRTIGRAELRDMGVLHLPDLVPRLPDWSVSSVALRTWWASPAGLSSYDDPGWDVWLDGSPVELEVAGLINLDHLPVPIGAVDSVVVTSVPVLRDGRFADAGRIHVHTTRPPAGIHVRAGGSVTQPTRDPGALAETPFATPNVDRLAETYHAGLEGGAGPVHAAAAFTHAGAFHTDPELDRRVFAVQDPAEHYPFAGTWGFRGNVWLQDVGGGEHRLVLGRSEQDDFLHHPDLAVEAPTRIGLRFAGLSGDLRPSPPLRLEYGLSWSENRLAPDASLLPFAFDLQQRRLGGRLAATAHSPSWRWTAGVAGERRRERLDGGGPFDVDVVRLFGAVGVEGAGRVELEVGRTAGRTAARGALTAGRRLGVGLITARVSAARRTAPERTDLWSLWARGLTAPEDRGLDPVLADGTGVRDLYALDLEYHLSANRLGLRLFGDIRHVTGALLARPRFEPGDPIPAPVGTTEVTRADGDVLGVGVEVDGAWRDGRLTAGGHYRWRTAVDGRPFRSDPAFSEGWRRIPAHAAQLRAALRGPAAVVFHARAEAWSATRWSRHPRERDGRLLPFELAGGATLDLGVRKLLFDGRTEVGALVRDVFDADRRRSPLGAAPGITTAVYAEVLTGWGG